MNIPVLVIQIMLNVQERNYDQAIERINALEQYNCRHAPQSDYFRTDCFIQLLRQIPEGFFHREAVQRRADKYLIQLRSVPVEVAYLAHEIEIMPYDELWQIAVDSLSNQFYKPVRKSVATTYSSSKSSASAFASLKKSSKSTPQSIPS